MTRDAIKIGVVSGAPSSTVQRLMRELALRWQQSARVVGVVEDTGQADSACNAGQLLSLVDGSAFPIFQNLGRGSTACNVHPEGAMSAGEAVRRDIAAGCDLVLLSKFGKLEAELGGGLVTAFVAAVCGCVETFCRRYVCQSAGRYRRAGSMVAKRAPDSPRIVTQ